MSTRTRTAPTALRRVAVSALLVAFVLAQALGWMHRGLHGSGAAPAAVASLHAQGERSAHALSSGIAGLFDGHADASDCRLFDAIAQPGCAPSHAAVLPLPLLQAVLLASHGDFVARWSALFDARGPPPSR